jgi:hypothetical protein
VLAVKHKRKQGSPGTTEKVALPSDLCSLTTNHTPGMAQSSAITPETHMAIEKTSTGFVCDTLVDALVKQTHVHELHRLFISWDIFKQRLTKSVKIVRRRKTQLADGSVRIDLVFENGKKLRVSIEELA